MNAEPTPEPPESVEALTQQIIQSLSHGATIGDLLNLEERDYEVLYSLGHTLYQQRRFEEASKLFGVLVAHNHFERRYIKAFAASLQMAQDYHNAIRLYTLAAAMDMTDPQPCLNTCECLIALGQRDDAAEGLGIVLRQCKDGLHPRVQTRAQALLDLLTHQSTAKE